MSLRTVWIRCVLPCLLDITLRPVGVKYYGKSWLSRDSVVGSDMTHLDSLDFNDQKKNAQENNQCTFSVKIIILSLSRFTPSLFLVRLAGRC